MPLCINLRGRSRRNGASEAKVRRTLLGRDIGPAAKPFLLGLHEGDLAGNWLAGAAGGKACNVDSIDALPAMFEAMTASGANAMTEPTAGNARVACTHESTLSREWLQTEVTRDAAADDPQKAYDDKMGLSD